MKQAKKLYDAGKFEELEDFADRRLDEASNLLMTAISSKSRKEFDIDDIRWEIFVTLTGSHFIDSDIAGLKLKMDLNKTGVDPSISLT